MSSSSSPSRAEPLLRARGLGLAHGKTLVLRGVDLDVHPGDVWYLVGSNGSGKTTFLHAALGLLRPREGELHRDPERMAGTRIGFVPQGDPIGSALPTTVREFVSLGFVASDVPRRERPEQLAWSLERTGLPGLERHDFRALSGGQRQRALLARALVRRPRLLMLDEPTEALDANAEQEFLETLEGLRRGDPELTMLIVTHALDLAAREATHLALFDAGTVIAGPRAAMLEAAAEGGDASVAARLLRATGPHHPHGHGGGS